MSSPNLKKIQWLPAAQKAIREFPDQVKGDIGFALNAVENGSTPPNAKRLKGLSDVWEIVEDHDTNTYRAIYAVKSGTLHTSCIAFRKRARRV